MAHGTVNPNLINDGELETLLLLKLMKQLHRFSRKTDRELTSQSCCELRLALQ